MHGDSHYELKTIMSKYDVVLENILNTPIVSLINPELIKEFYQPSGDFKYKKLPMFVENMKRVMGNGLSFKEGLEWKKRRKIMNTIFNYDFISENIPKIC